MEGLGYRQNQHAFLMLAQRAGYADLRRAAALIPVWEQVSAIEAWLVDMSGSGSEGGKWRSPISGDRVWT